MGFRRGMCAIGMLLWAMTGTAFAGDAPSVFEPKRMSSSAITTMVESCQARAEGSIQDDGEVLGTSWHFCACVTDAMRVEHKKSGMSGMMRKARNQTWLVKKQTRCLKHAQAQLPKSFGAGAPTSVFDRREMGSASVTSGFLGCDLSKDTDGTFKSSLEKMDFCSCIGDAMRVRYRKLGQAKFLQESLSLRAAGSQGSQFAKHTKRCLSYVRGFAVRNKH